MMGWHYDGVGGGGWLLMTVMMLAFWALVIVAVVAIFRGIGKPEDAGERPTGREPLGILQERFARGEIESEEYEARARVLWGQVSEVPHKTTT
jgi:putative membrane protein